MRAISTTLLRDLLKRALVMLPVLGMTLAPRLQAQDTAGTDLFASWLDNQRDLLARVEAFSIEAEVDHRVATPDGERHATYGLLFNRDWDDPQGRGMMRYFIMDGDSLDVSERRRVERILSSMMTDDVGPLLNGLSMPARLLSRATVVRQAEPVEWDGRTLTRIVFELDPPRGIQGPGQRPGMRPGVRPGSPAGRRGPAGRVPPAGMEPPRPRIAAFFDAVTGHLVMTRLRANLPGDRSFRTETTFQRVQGIDIPLARHVQGDFPVRRRLRTVTLSLDHRTRFRVERLVVDAE